ncbi:MAG TPA: SRPBCC family protein [Polyangiaceae bacterium]|nr:SRPBCC family protein [Polyangiaceae bacterium]
MLESFLVYYHSDTGIDWPTHLPPARISYLCGPTIMFKRIWIDETVDVGTNADTLYALLKDFDAWPEWTPGLRALKRDRKEPLRVGAKFVMVIGRLSLPCQVFAYGPSRLEWGGGLGPSIVRHSFELTPVDAAQCRLRHLEYATGVLAALALPMEKALGAYDHRWTKTICARFAST